MAHRRRLPQLAEAWPRDDIIDARLIRKIRRPSLALKVAEPLDSVDAFDPL